MNKIKIGCPIDYTDNEDIERTGLFLREPEIEELEKRLKEINKITDLEQQCKKQKEVIEKSIELLNKFSFEINVNGQKQYIKLQDLSQGKEVLKLLNGVSK